MNRKYYGLVLPFLLVLSSASYAFDRAHQTRSYADVKKFLRGDRVDRVKTDKDSVAVSYYNTMPYTKWLKDHSGQYVQLTVTPIQTALIEQILPSMPSEEISLSPDDPEHVREFKGFINRENVNLVTGEYARNSVLISDPEEAAKRKKERVHVIESIQSGVVKKGIEDIKSVLYNEDELFSLFRIVDPDHSKYAIPYEVLSQSLDEQHVGHGEDPDSKFVLSVLDFDTYDCSNLTSALARADYFLPNNSIYNLGVIEFIPESDLNLVNIISEEKPKLGVRLRGLKSFHLLDNSSVTLLFYGINDINSRVVILSNISMGSDKFEGSIGSALKSYLEDGFGTLLLSAALGVADVLLGEDDTLDDDDFGIEDVVDADVDAEIEQLNLCDKGIGQGLKPYGKKIFENLVEYLESN